jgi:hypothetical protein
MRKIEFTMERLRNLALGMIVVLNVIATVTAFGESYAGLYRWAFEHNNTGFWGAVWPLMVDLIVLVAEAGLFVAHHDKWMNRHKAWLWFVMFTALGVSIGGNTGHVHSTDWLSHLTAALPPVALMFTMTVGFGVMKRTFMNKKPEPARPQERAHVGTVPWIENPALAGSQIAPAPNSHASVSPAETPDLSPAETPAPEVPEADENLLSETMVKLGFKTTEKSFTMPKDPRTEITLAEKRVRDMYDVDPDISVNAIAKALGIAWATADKYLKATKEARGLPV